MGHYLSACALMHASADDAELKARDTSARFRARFSIA
jgi:hypothetical protein